MSDQVRPGDAELPEPITVALIVSAALDTLGISHYIGGSLASAMHGVSRATMDVDLIADLKPEHAEPLVHLLADQFYVDSPMILDAISRRQSFNIIHLGTMLKVYIFASKPGAYAQMQLRRRVSRDVGAGQQAFFASAEDIVLAKLQWYQMGGQVSDRQWSDILGVLKVQGKLIDRDYLRRWAKALALDALLARALEAVDKWEEMHKILTTPRTRHPEGTPKDPRSLGHQTLCRG